MKNRIKLNRAWLQVCFLFFVMFLFSCQQKMDEYYKIPDWLKGSAWQVLEAKGNYTLFLQAADKTGYKSMLEGKGIITVVAPDDEAFNKWLSQQGYASINDVPDIELKKVITFHLLYYSFSKDMLANYRPEGRTSTDYNSASSAGLYYKFRTNSNDPVSIEEDNTVREGGPVSREIFHKERFVPVLSSYTFQTLGIDAKSNYEYFYPNSTWTGDDGGFNISNASVTEYAIVTDNGYIYTVDKVLEPLETIYTKLNNSPNYSIFLSMYKRFVDFEQNDDIINNYGPDYYLEYFYNLPAIASEWTYNGEYSGSPDYSRLDLLARETYNVYAPENESLQNFFNSFWGDYYTSIDKVSFLPLMYLLGNHVYSGDIVFPELITQGKVKTTFGTVIDFDPQQTDLRQMCSNGTLYGLKNMMVPEMFQSVTAPIFQDPKYTMFLLMMDNSGLIQPLMSKDMTFTLFMPTDDLILNTTIAGNDLIYVDANPNQFGQQQIQINGDNGYLPLSMSRQSMFASNHIATRLVTKIGNQKVYKTLLPYQYLLEVDDSKIYSTNLYNNYSEGVNDKPGYITKVYTAYNGESYDVSGDDATMALLPDESAFKDQITKNTPEEFKSFKANMLDVSKIATTIPPFNFMLSDRFIIFIPSADAIDAASSAGTLPVSQEDMEKQIRYLFVNVNTSGLVDYPFPGDGSSKTLTTYLTNPSTHTSYKLTLIDTGNSLQVQDEKGNIVNVIGVFPHIYSDGAAYLIDGMLNYE